MSGYDLGADARVLVGREAVKRIGEPVVTAHGVLSLEFCDALSSG